MSAYVTDAEFLSRISKVVTAVISKQMTPDEAKEVLGRYLQRIGYEPELGEENTIQDLSSDARLQLIVRTNVDMAKGYGKFVAAQSKLEQEPWWELYRAEARIEPRDWPTRWREAGGRLRRGKMIAPVNDGIWTRISAFGHPYPPFDFNSGMSVRGVALKVGKGMGIALPKQKPVKVKPFNEGLKSSLAVDDPAIRKALLRALGARYDVGDDGVLKYASRS